MSQSQANPNNNQAPPPPSPSPLGPPPLPVNVSTTMSSSSHHQQQQQHQHQHQHRLLQTTAINPNVARIQQPVLNAEAVAALQQQLQLQQLQQQAQLLRPQANIPALIQNLTGYNPQFYNHLLTAVASGRIPAAGFQTALPATATAAAPVPPNSIIQPTITVASAGPVHQSNGAKDSDSDGNSVQEPTNKQSPSSETSAAMKVAGVKRSSSSVVDSETGDGQEDANERRRRKHNELEVKRRQRINEKFQELQDLCNSKSDRRSVLQSAIDMIQSYSTRIQSLEAQAQQYQQQLSAGELYRANGPRALAPLASQRTGAIDFQSVYRNLSAPIAVMSLDGRFVDCNDAMCMLFGKNREDIEQTTMFGLANPKDLANLFSKVQRLITGDDDFVVFSTYYSHATNTQIPLTTIVFSVREQGDIQSLLWLGVRTPSLNFN
jgi:PAS domain S-box-containing protein